MVPFHDDPARDVESETGAFAHVFVVKKGSNARACTSAGIPGPVSAISTTT